MIPGIYILLDLALSASSFIKITNRSYSHKGQVQIKPPPISHFLEKKE